MFHTFSAKVGYPRPVRWTLEPTGAPVRDRVVPVPTVAGTGCLLGLPSPAGPRD